MPASTASCICSDWAPRRRNVRIEARVVTDRFTEFAAVDPLVRAFGEMRGSAHFAIMLGVLPTKSVPWYQSLSIARNPGIDVLRGLSILLVILNHIGIRIPLKATAVADFVPASVMTALNWNGYEAVFVFFVLSGFLITRHSLMRWGTPGAIDARAFYARRAGRIVPCLLLLLSVLSLLHLMGTPNYTIDRPGQSLPRALLAVLGLHLNWYEGVTGYLPGGWDVLWSLSIEEVFYLAFPIVCLLVRDVRLLVILMAVLALSLPFTHGALKGNEIWQEKAYLPGMAAIATGVLAAVVAARRPLQSARIAVFLCIVGASGLVAILFFERLLWSFVGEYALLVLTFSVASLAIGFEWHESDRAHAWPGTGWLRSMGRLSYEIYLGHMFIVFALVGAFRASGADLRWGWTIYPPVVILSWLLGQLVASLFSMPAERWLRNRIDTSALPAAAEVE